MRKKKSHVYKSGDIVEVINPQFVERIGYPISILSIHEELKRKGKEEALREHFIDVIKTMCVSNQDYDEDASYTELLYARGSKFSIGKIMDDLAYLILIKKGFGGREKSVHTKEIPELRNKRFRVIDKKVKYTGKYTPSSGVGEEYERPYLENTKAHIILSLEPIYEDNLMNLSSLDSHMRIEEINVKPIEWSED